jgi:lipopolysaccharide/colanic/teichoic acid biosynthesis glycosyltransferase
VGTGALDPVEMPAAVSVQDTGRHRFVDVGCRIVDVLVASIALVILSPLLLAIAIVVRLESAGPAVFSQRRVGRGQQPFTLHKFRTMTAGASHDRHREYVQGLLAGQAPPQSEGGPRFKMAADPRITRVGRTLRRSSLDELPQLWNVIRGDMSLVGPRPPISYEVDHYPAPHWFTRFDVKPGMTGLWQVSGRCDLTLAQMIDLDIEYVHRRSVHLNLWILIRTLPAVLTSRGAS